MKQVIATTENTDVWALAQILNDEQIKDLLWSLQAQKKIYIPQYYNNEQSKYFGFDDVDDMRCRLDGIHEQIDEIVGDFFYE